MTSPYFLRAPEAGCFCTRLLARVRALPPRPLQCLALRGLAGHVFCPTSPCCAARICSHPTSPLPRGQGAGDGGRLWSGGAPRAHLRPRSRSGEGRGWTRRLGGSGLCWGWAGLWTSLSPTRGLGFPSFTTGPTISGYGQGGWWTNQA